MHNLACLMDHASSLWELIKALACESLTGPSAPRMTATVYREVAVPLFAAATSQAHARGLPVTPSLHA